jgi:hypothetical protein
MKASDIRLDTPQSFLFKGPFGFGKTLAAASFALAGPVYISYWDKKAPVELITFFTKERFGDKAEKILDNITFDVYSADNAGDYLNKLINFLSDCRYTAIINDSITFMTASAVNWSLNFGKKEKALKAIKDILPSWDEYKVETSLISQCLDLSRKLPCHVIWTAHPLPTTKVESAGSSVRVTKINSIVSYGSKVAGIAPGAFTEIYHFSQQANWDSNTGKGSKRYIVGVEAIGDEFAKSPLLSNKVKEFDITDKLFYEVWKGLINEAQGKSEITVHNTITESESTVNNPFNKPSTQWKT